MTSDRTVTEHYAQILKFQLEQAISASTLKSCRSDAFFKDAINCLVVQLQADILALDGQTETTHTDHKLVTIKYPATWLQHFKKQFAPAWFLRRWPVRLIEQHIGTIHYHQTTIKRLCPHLKVPENHAHYHFLVHGEQSFR